MKLYKIMFTHYSPKDTEDGIKGYVLAETEVKVMQYIDVTYRLGGWSDADPLEVWDSKLEKLIERPFLDKVMKERGDYWEEVSDLHYGATQYEWDEGVEISNEDAAVLLRLKVAEPTRGEG